MIKVNLLPQKRAKKRGGVGAPGVQSGTQPMILGIGVLAGLGVIIFLFADKPKRDELNELDDKIANLDSEMAPKNKELAGSNHIPSYVDLKRDFESADARALEVERLMQARIIPANVLHELGEILFPNRMPTMTDDMAKKAGGADPNKKFQLDWDPTHVWLTSYADTGGSFKMEGGAQSEADVTQLSKRLAASVYFFDVAAARQEIVPDKDTGLNYYKFTITGKVAY
jgi:Tfp pilus assembly protein PilN